MKKIFQLIAAISVFSLFSVVPLAAFADIPVSQIAKDNSLAPMLKRVTPSVVNISVESVTLKKLNQLITTPEGGDRKIPVKTYAVGSGVIFNAQKGYIVTNAHVIKNEKLIVVTLKDGQRYHAKLIAKDNGYDIAVLQIHARHLKALPFADSNKLKVGDFVSAIGSPYNLSQTVTSGVVSALNRTHPKIEGYQNFIQTDASINPGNSGGALVNMHGKLVGINTAIIAPTPGNTGIGFAIPSNMVHSVITQLLKYGKVKHGVLGVIVQNITPSLESALGLHHRKGALISEVLPGTPAANAGLKSEDVIVRVNHQSIHSSIQLRNVMGLIRPNTSITITAIRDQKAIPFHVIVGNPKTLKQKTLPYFAKMRLQTFNELETNGDRLKGVIVTSVSDSSNGALAGLHVGDVITAIDNKPISTITQLKNIALHHSKPLLLTIKRGTNSLFLVIRSR